MCKHKHFKGVTSTTNIAHNLKRKIRGSKMISSIAGNYKETLNINSSKNLRI